MSWERETSCVGCAECIGCGRKHENWLVCYCDECGDSINKIIFTYNDEDLCSSCAAKVVFNMMVPEPFRENEKKKMHDEGYDWNELEDVYDWFQIPTKYQLDCSYVDQVYD